MSRGARERSAFTLVELMVSLTIGGFAIGSMYSIGVTLTRQYHQQHQAANAMTSLRMAMDQVKRDISRAGFMSTPSVGPSPPHTTLACAAYAEHDPAGSGSLGGISHFDDDICDDSAGCDNLNVAENITSGFTSDRLTMFGNYETGSEYPSVEVVTASTVAIGANSHAFQTDFTNWFISGSVIGSAAFDVTLFNRAFSVGRLIRIRTTDGRHHFAAITGVTAPTASANVRVSFAPAVPGPCLAAADGGSIAPVSAIRYFPRDDPDPPEPDPDDNPFGPMAQLVREEVQPAGKILPLTINDGTDFTNTRVVLDYLVSFNLGFVTKGADLAVGDPDVYTPGVPNANATVVNANPERVRAVQVELSVRAPEQDRTLPWSATTCAALGCYRVWSDRPGAARVRTLRAEVFIPNIAYEGY